MTPEMYAEYCEVTPALRAEMARVAGLIARATNPKRTIGEVAEATRELLALGYRVPT